MAGLLGVRNIAAAAGVDPREVVALLAGGDMRQLGWLGCRAMACLVEERRVAKEVDISAFIRAATEITSPPRQLDMTAFIRAATEIH